MLGRLPYGKDFVKTIQDFCVQESIQTGVFSVIGAVARLPCMLMPCFPI
jgi:predicted DNA-binding protein with PD1-like motif